MGKNRISGRGLFGAAAVFVLGGLAAACGGPDEPAPVFMKGGTPAVADAGAAPSILAPRPSMSRPQPSMAGPPPGIAGPPPSAAPVQPPRQITVERGMQVGKLAVQYHVSKQAIIAANHLEPPDYKVKIGTRLSIPGGAAPATQQAMASPPPSSGSNPNVIPLDEPPASRRAAASPPKPAAPPPAVAAVAPPPSSPSRPAMPPPPAVAAAAPAPRPVPPPAAAAVPQPVTPAAAPGRSIAFPPREPSAAEEARAEAAASPPLIQSTGSRFPWPVRGKVLGVYGVAADGTHNDGINIAASRGTPIKSVESGIVAYVGNELRGYGNLILVKHTNGWISAYAHCDEVLVRKGDPVYRGQTIAKVGATGGVTEPQLHFELRQGKRPVDPRGFLEPAPSA